MPHFFTKKRMIALALAVAVAALFVLVALHFRKSSSGVLTEIQKPPQDVTVQSVADSTRYEEKIQYPATIAGDQEISVSATTSGTAKVTNFELGSYVSAGSLLVKIDDVGPFSKTGDKNFKSSDVNQAELDVKQAEEEVEVAEANYDSVKQQYDYQKDNPSLPQTVTRAQKDAAKEAVDVAKIHLKNLKVGYKGTLDDHLVTSPISGYVTQKSVSTGDSVATGQALFSISKTKKIKIQFYVDEQQLDSIEKGTELSLTDNSGNQMPIIVRNISPQADPVTRRFLVEAYLKQDPQLFPGTIVSVSFSFEKTPSEPDALILPLSAINIGQNENYIFIAENGHAKKVNVDLVNVSGETADVKANLSPGTEIILNGSRLVSDGAAINIVQ
jgi:RND family efflux transporter MFP subunit